MKQVFQQKENHLTKHDQELVSIYNTLKANKEDREELHRICEAQAEKASQDRVDIEKKISERFNKLLDK